MWSDGVHDHDSYGAKQILDVNGSQAEQRRCCKYQFSVHVIANTQKHALTAENLLPDRLPSISWWFKKGEQLSWANSSTEGSL